MLRALNKALHLGNYNSRFRFFLTQIVTQFLSALFPNGESVSNSELPGCQRSR
jgi:hypothetical protein